ncbi:MAG TPA: beta-propeller fold lactonase family protein [Tepidisphaeraceae bacterium]|nr:beta-propeller fold lactonase family protein [Tepidisphaeraceae bacterium]
MPGKRQLLKVMRAAFVGAAVGFFGAVGCSHESKPAASRQHVEPADNLPTPLATGHSIEPRSQASQEVGTIPINMIASPDGKFAVSTDQGFDQALWSIRTSDGAGISHVDFPKKPDAPANGLYYGLAFAPDGTLYASQGAADAIRVLQLDSDGNLTAQDTIKTRKGDFPSGLALDEHKRLYVANNDPHPSNGMPFKVPGSIAIYDTARKQELGRFEFTDSFGGMPNFPLALAVLNDGSKLYVASQRDSAVYVLKTSAPSDVTLASTIPTGSHPVSLLLDRTQSRLFVANAQSDTVSVVDTTTDKVIATVLLRPEIARDVVGATPIGLALSPDEKTLYVTLADMNAVAVVDVNRNELLGYIPAGWYPTAVVASPDNQRLLIANAKGITARLPNPPPGPKARHVSPIALLKGTVMTAAVPSNDELKAQTRRVLELDRLTPRYLHAENPLRSIGLQAGKITHVIYIVKENRSYDQVLGDMTQGNGDPNRCIFGRKVTPNQHALAERFVLLDNFYDCGEVSGDGWTWTTQAQANEYVARNVPYSYSGRGRTYDYEGLNDKYPVGGFPARSPEGKPLSQDPQYQNGAPAVPDVGESPGGHIWDLVRKHGLSYRNYGFFLSDQVRIAGKTIIPDNYPNSPGLQPGGHDLEGVSDLDFRHFDLNYADSEAPLKLATQTGDKKFLRPRTKYGIHDAPSRFSEWNDEFQQMLAKAPDGGAVPNFMTIRFCVDHTMGTNPNHHSPRSMVTDNDYAVGQLVETISRSPIWKSTAIFIVEDDAQDGPDHVDTHRSTCYVISPWIKAHSVDHTFQNTVSLIRTMELLMGLPPMCQYDATATPILDWDTHPSNDARYAAVLPDPAILAEINGARSPKSPISPEQHSMMEESSKMDFAHADRAPADRLNEIIWKSVKGYNSVMPPTPHGPLPASPRPADRDDD